MSPLGSSADEDFDRIRLRGGEGLNMESDDDSDNFEDAVSDQRHRAVPRGSGSRPTALSAAEFQPGAIVRVKVENFVTYEKAEFFLGPNLNMVIGPNGTGKSSLVCAICLGLGYPSSVLGRASAFGEFVKHGKDEAEIEVELQKKEDDPDNYVVGLCIRKEDNSRKFSINGSRATVKEIQQLMKSLRIQIDNLCQFLPQDKVAEFAGLTPVDLLEKTLHAAAPPEMIQWRNELKDHFQEQKEAQRNAEGSREQLEKMEARQQVLQADVDKLQERKKIQDTIEKLEGMHLVVRYDEARRAYGDVKKRKKDAEKNLKVLQRNSAPSLEAVNKKQKYQSRIQAVVDDRKNALADAEDAARRADNAIVGADSKFKELQTMTETEKASFDAKKEELGKTKRNITHLEAKRKQLPREFDPGEFNRKIRELEHHGKAKANGIAALQEQRSEMKREGVEKRKQRDGFAKELQALQSQQGRVLARLKNLDPAVARGYEWLRENQDKFDKEVFGPPMVTCSVKNQQYSDLIQSMLQSSDFFCFTTQTKEDHIKLSNQFYKEMRLSVTIRTCVKPLNAFQPPVPRDRLAEMGFDGYVVDYIDGPEPVLAMLCGEKRLHLSAVALQPLSDDNLERVLKGGAINQFACGDQTYRVTRRREYGDGATSTRIDTVRPAQYWTMQPVDESEGKTFKEQIEALNKELAVDLRKLEDIQDREEQLKEEGREIEDKVTRLKHDKSELQAEYTRWQQLPERIESEKVTLRQTEDQLRESRKRQNEIEREKSKALIAKADAILDHQEKIMGIREAWQSYLEAQLLLLEAKSDYAYLKDRNSEIMKLLETEKKAINELEREQDQKKAEATEALEAVKAMDDEIDRDELVSEAGDRTAANIEAELSAERAKLEVIQANNPQALEEFEMWTRRIQKERTDYQKQEVRLKDLAEQIETIRSQWEPRLDELVGKINDAFSYNFEQISCAGEVGVHKDEDFAKWAIEIRVKFRQNETLQRLDQHRQSGGERAVSTIFYLMSLQSMAQAPFRVVDEINQGMDPRNERMVHERMVEIACREHTSQYFLITPKLLSGLRYDERMRVHTIVSGEHVDVNGTELMDFAKFAKIQRRLMGR